MPTSSSSLRTELLGDGKALRECFARARYNEEAMTERFGAVPVANSAEYTWGRWQTLTSNGTPFDTLLRLFLFHIPVPVAEAERALQPLPMDLALTAGLIAANGGAVLGQLTILPYQGLLIAFDIPSKIEEGSHGDWAMPLTNSTILLADARIPRRARKSLDMGTGCGVLAMLLSAQSEQVIAVDKNPRAIDFTRFNALLNGLTNVTAIEGDGFTPVEGQEFDLILGNLPFAITPSMRYVYRDNPLPVDEFARRMVEQSGQHLAEGGYAQLQCSWVQTTGQTAEERLQDWFTDSGCDVWVLETSRRTPEEYADAWIRESEPPRPEENARLYDEWVAYYRGEGIDRLCTGMILLHRVTRDRNWISIEEAPQRNPGGIGAAIEQGFALREFLFGLKDDRELLWHSLRVSPDVRLAQSARWEDGRWLTERADLAMSGGLAYRGEVDQNILRLIAGADGRHPVSEIVRQLAAELHVQPQQIEAGVLAVIRPLVERGYLLPEHLAGTPSGTEKQDKG